MKAAARRWVRWAMLALAVFVSGCGGGGGNAVPPEVPPTPIPADLSITPPAQPEEALAQAWGNSAATLSGVNFSWNFGDGKTSTEPRPTHAFAAPGSYTVTLTVSNQGGQSREVTRVVDVARFKPVSGASCGGPGETGWCLLGGARRVALQLDGDGRGWFGNELGEIHTSTDAGQTWTRVLRQQGGAVLAIQSDATAVRALTDQGWVWKSTDRGATWTHTRSGETFSLKDGDVPPSLQAVGERTVIVNKTSITQDDGLTWRHLPGRLLEASPDGTLWFSTTRDVASPGGIVNGEYWVADLQRSRDGGLTATTVFTTPVIYGKLSVVVQSNTRLLAVAPVRTADGRREYWQWRSEDGGDSWTGQAAPGIPLAPLGDSGLDLYAGSSGADWMHTPSGLFRRSSASEPWVYVHEPMAGPCMGTRLGEAGLALACRQGFGLTTDGGLSWRGELDYANLRTQNGGAVELERGRWWVSRHISRQASGTVALSVDGTLLLSDDGANPWRVVLRSPDLRQVWMTDRRNGWAVNGQGELLATADGGRSWTAKSAPVVDIAWPSLRFADAKTGWMKASSGSLMRTEDGGTTWQALTPTDAGSFARYQFFDGKLGVALHTTDYLGTNFHNTADGGKSWTGAGRIPISFRPLLAFRNAEVGLVAGADGKVARTADGGMTWQAIPVAPAWIKDMVFVNDNVVLAIAAADYVVRSADAGRTWSFVNVNGVVDTSRLQTARDGRTVWLVGSAGQIFRSSDAGLNWQLQDPGALAPAVARSRFTDAFFHDAQTGWLVDDLGRLWVTDSGGE